MLFILIGCAAGIKNPFVNINKAVSTDYGYSDENPIRIGYSKNFKDNVDLCIIYISNLRTIAGESLNIISRVSVDDPKNDPSTRSGFLGLPIRGAVPAGGILDAYTLVSENEFDTLLLYFDIYHKEKLHIPDNLLFVNSSKQISSTGN